MVFGDAYRGRRVLVTGHTGFKGSWLCEWLLSVGAEVAGFSKDIPSRPSHFEAIGLSSRLRRDERGDVRDLAGLRDVFGAFQPEVVFHLAAQALVRDSYDDPKGTFDTNVGGTVNVLECLRSAPSVRSAVLVASDKCYENREWEFGYRETDPLGGKDPYSASKGAAEIVFASYARSFFGDKGACCVASARAGNVIGGGDWAKDRIVPDLARSWSAGTKAEIRSPKSTRPWQHVLEPLGAYLWLGAELLRSPGGVAGESFNFGPGADSARTVSELIEELVKTWAGSGIFIDTSAVGHRKEARLLHLSCDRAQARLSWLPTLVFAESGRMTAEWYRDYYATPTRARDLTARHLAEYQRLAAERGRAWAR